MAGRAVLRHRGLGCRWCAQRDLEIVSQVGRRLRDAAGRDDCLHPLPVPIVGVAGAQACTGNAHQPSLGVVAQGVGHARYLPREHIPIGVIRVCAAAHGGRRMRVAWRRVGYGLTTLARQIACGGVVGVALAVGPAGRRQPV